MADARFFVGDNTVKKFVILFAAILMVQTITAGQQKGKPHIYDENKVTPAMVDEALKTARSQNKFLMVEFGADWCSDCVALARSLEQGQTAEYLRNHFVVLKVNVGQFDRNLDIAKSLGVDLNKGIPTAVFYTAGGSRIGATNNGELEASRKYGSKQIYGFLRGIAERKIITSPGK
jgi:thioredoxin